MSDPRDALAAAGAGSAAYLSADGTDFEEWERIWTTPNGGFEIWRKIGAPLFAEDHPFSLFHHGEWVGDYWYTQQAKRDAVPQDCSKCGDQP